jgi:hypothetical protein
VHRTSVARNTLAQAMLRRVSWFAVDKEKRSKLVAGFIWLREDKQRADFFGRPLSCRSDMEQRIATVCGLLRNILMLEGDSSGALFEGLEDCLLLAGIRERTEKEALIGDHGAQTECGSAQEDCVSSQTNDTGA